jgi:hypothetical protein
MDQTLTDVEKRAARFISRLPSQSQHNQAVTFSNSKGMMLTLEVQQYWHENEELLNPDKDSPTLTDGRQRNSATRLRALHQEEDRPEEFRGAFP